MRTIVEPTAAMIRKAAAAVTRLTPIAPASHASAGPTSGTNCIASGFAAWARIDRNKGFDRALDLIAALVANGHDARFDLHGPDGGARGELEAQARRLGIADRVHFHGPLDRTKLPRVAAEASFFLLPSRFEGMAMACVEAMQLGLVPVVTPAGEMAHYVVPGETGILIDPDRIGDSAAEVAALLAAPDRFAAMRTAATAPTSVKTTVNINWNRRNGIAASSRRRALANEPPGGRWRRAGTAGVTPNP